MKKTILLTLPLIIGVLALPMMADAQMMGGGMMGGWGGYGGGYGGQYPPYGGQYQGPQGPGGGYGPGPGGYGMGPGRGYGMGPGMMGPGRGYGMGPGMMGPGYGNPYGPQYGPQYGSGPQYQQQNPLDMGEAKNRVENYLKATRNPNLKLGELKDKGSHFEADIVTKKGNSLVDKIYVDKNTGWMRSAY